MTDFEKDRLEALRISDEQWQRNSKEYVGLAGKTWMDERHFFLQIIKELQDELEDLRYEMLEEYDE